MPGYYLVFANPQEPGIVLRHLVFVIYDGFIQIVVGICLLNYQSIEWKLIFGKTAPLWEFRDTVLLADWQSLQICQKNACCIFAITQTVELCSTVLALKIHPPHSRDFSHELGEWALCVLRGFLCFDDQKVLSAKMPSGNIFHTDGVTIFGKEAAA